MRLFKRQAPNDMKKGDLIVKWWIITDLPLGIHETPIESKLRLTGYSRLPFHAGRMRQVPLLLYSQQSCRLTF
jgi:hypothetical protein